MQTKSVLDIPWLSRLNIMKISFPPDILQIDENLRMH